MNDPLPPPLPGAETAFATYLKASATVLPALLIWLFSNAFLLPRLQLLWSDANLSDSKAQWIMDASYFFTRSVGTLFAVVLLLLVALEVFVRAWPRFRRTTLSVLAVTFHTAVLLGLAAISTSVLVAAPILTRTK